MYKGHPLTLEQILPAGISPDMFYMIAASVPAMLVVAALGTSLTPRNAMTARVRALNERQQELRGELTAPKRRRKRGHNADISFIRRIVSRFNLLKSQQISQAQSLIMEAGWRSKDAMVIFAFFTLVCPIIFGIIGLIMWQLQIFGESKRMLNTIAPIAMLYIGLKLPTMVASRRRRKRYRNIQRALSDTLDLMTICAEAGLSLGSALQRVSKELAMVYPEMSEEVGLTATEMSFLPDRNKALLNLSDRVKIDEIRGIVNVLIQTEKYGTPIAQAMRVLASEFREQRMLRAENKAARLPAVMTVPMITMILPTLFIVVISPAAIRASDAM
jgi:tight adherence protein C